MPVLLQVVIYSQSSKEFMDIVQQVVTIHSILSCCLSLCFPWKWNYLDVKYKKKKKIDHYVAQIPNVCISFSKPLYKNRFMFGHFQNFTTMTYIWGYKKLGCIEFRNWNSSSDFDWSCLQSRAEVQLRFLYSRPVWELWHVGVSVGHLMLGASYPDSVFVAWGVTLAPLLSPAESG